jgi:hypothetical protein
MKDEFLATPRATSFTQMLLWVGPARGGSFKSTN